MIVVVVIVEVVVEVVELEVFDGEDGTMSGGTVRGMQVTERVTARDGGAGAHLCHIRPGPMIHISCKASLVQNP